MRSSVSSSRKSGLALPLGLLVVGWCFAVAGQSGTVPVVLWGAPGAGLSQPPADLTNVLAVAAGFSDALAVREDGVVRAWGDDNQYGQLEVPADATNAVAVGVGDFHCIALRADGSVKAWGFNVVGLSTPPASATNVIALAAGSYHNLALRADRSLVAWGINADGQCNIPASATNVVALAAGAYHSLALRADGTPVAWGENYYGQTIIPGSANNLVAIAAGEHFCMGLRADGNVLVWGDNRAGETNVPAAATNVIAIGAGHQHCLALRGDGSVLSWGNFTAVPATASNAVVLAGGFYYSLALLRQPAFLAPASIWQQPQDTIVPVAGTAVFSCGASGPPPLSYQWLLDDTPLAGQTNQWLGLSNVSPAQEGAYRVVVSSSGGAVTSAPAMLSVPVILLTRSPASQVVPAGTNVIFAVAAIGAPPLTYQWRLGTTNLPGATGMSLALTNVQAVNAGDYDVAVSNSFGAVTSAVATLTVAPAAPFILSQPRSVAASVGQAVGLAVSAQGTAPLGCQWQKDGLPYAGATGFSLSFPRADGSVAGVYRAVLTNSVGATLSTPATVVVTPVLAWGNATYGLTAIPPTATNLVAIAAGNSASGTPCLALRADGTLLAWGYPPKDPPVPATATGVVAVAVGGGFTPNEPPPHSLALRSDGTVVAWGANALGETNVSASASNVIAIAAGGAHCLAARVDGTVITWGNSQQGLTNIPAAATNVVAVAAGNSHSLALRADGAVVAWGAYTAGQTNVPAAATNIVAISACANQNLALRADGQVLGWGNVGQTPLPVPPSATNIVAISAGATHALALRPDGTILSWGGVSRYGETNVPPYASNVVAIAGGVYYSLALVSDPTMPILPVIGRQPLNRSLMAGSDLVLSVQANGGLLSYQWQCNGTNITGATQSILRLAGTQLQNAGSYSVLVSNGADTVRSLAATVLVWPKLRLERIGGDMVATWDGAFVLQAAANSAGPYLDVAGAASPYTNDPSSAPARYFRLRQGVGPATIRLLSGQQALIDWAGPFTLQSSTDVLGPYSDVPGATHPLTNRVSDLPRQFFRLRY